MKRLISAAATAVATAALLAACGTSKAAPEAAVTATPISASEATTAAQGTVVDITITSTSVSPSGGAASVGVNQPITFRIDASVAGEIHVHSTPEQHIEYPAGISEVTLSFKVPGNVVVEDHALDRQILQITVR